jgi:hypothetical protein
MNIDDRIVSALTKVNFSRWYTDFSKNHCDEETFENYDNESIKSIFNKLNIEFSFNKKENFYKIIQKTEAISVQLNLSLKYSVIELILAVTKNGERITVSGPFSFIYKKLNNGQRVLPAKFKDYTELESIIKEVEYFFGLLSNQIIQELKQ